MVVSPQSHIIGEVFRNTSADGIYIYIDHLGLMEPIGPLSKRALPCSRRESYRVQFTRFTRLPKARLSSKKAQCSCPWRLGGRSPAQSPLQPGSNGTNRRVDNPPHSDRLQGMQQ